MMGRYTARRFNSEVSEEQDFDQNEDAQIFVRDWPGQEITLNVAVSREAIAAAFSTMERRSK